MRRKYLALFSFPAGFFVRHPYGQEIRVWCGCPPQNIATGTVTGADPQTSAGAPGETNNHYGVAIIPATGCPADVFSRHYKVGILLCASGDW
ncbi:MAG: hypothetical protein ACPG7F_06245 [Aggregatilineales bacterium]